jgi:hypothetical protein
MAAFISRPVSSAMPNVPSPSPAATSSLVPPNAASSKSWIAAAPFMATCVSTPRSRRWISSGPSPTLMTCPPSSVTTALRRAAEVQNRDGSWGRTQKAYNAFVIMNATERIGE